MKISEFRKFENHAEVCGQEAGGQVDVSSCSEVTSRVAIFSESIIKYESSINKKANTWSKPPFPVAFRSRIVAD